MNRHLTRSLLADLPYLVRSTIDHTPDWVDVCSLHSILLMGVSKRPTLASERGAAIHLQLTLYDFLVIAVIFNMERSFFSDVFLGVQG
jgi:hypothetical protein